MYDYLENMVSDILEVITEYKDQATNMSELEDVLNEQLWIDDSVTGNASGSYFMNTYKAEDAVSHNWDILSEALREFGYDDVDVFDKGAEWADVTIRCYLLSQAIAVALEGMEDLYQEVEDVEEDIFPDDSSNLSMDEMG